MCLYCSRWRYLLWDRKNCPTWAEDWLHDSDFNGIELENRQRWWIPPAIKASHGNSTTTSHVDTQSIVHNKNMTCAVWLTQDSYGSDCYQSFDCEPHQISTASLKEITRLLVNKSNHNIHVRLDVNTCQHNYYYIKSNGWLAGWPHE